MGVRVWGRTRGGGGGGGRGAARGSTSRGCLGASTRFSPHRQPCHRPCALPPPTHPHPTPPPCTQLPGHHALLPPPALPPLFCYPQVARVRACLLRRAGGAGRPRGVGERGGRVWVCVESARVSEGVCVVWSAYVLCVPGACPAPPHTHSPTPPPPQVSSTYSHPPHTPSHPSHPPLPRQRLLLRGAAPPRTPLPRSPPTATTTCTATPPWTPTPPTRGSGGPTWGGC